MNPRTPFTRMSSRLRRARGWAALAAAAALLSLAVAGLTGVFPGSGTAGPSRADGPARTQPPPAQAGSHPGPASASRQSGRHPRTVADARHRPPRTSCTSVAHIGDSTSVGMIDPAVLPRAAQRLQAQYAHVGVRRLRVDASGGRSIVETLPGQINGYDAARNLARKGFRGCWVIALGVNDSANIAAGSQVGQAARIGRMMSAAHGRQVLWVNTRTQDAAGPYAEANMKLWNQALRRAQARYPNLRIFNWASVVRPGWYIPDGIHYTAAGYAVSAHAIAGALAKAFPAGGHSAGRIVR